LLHYLFGIRIPGGKGLIITGLRII